MDKSSKIKGLIRSITGTDRPSFGFRLMEVVSVEDDLCRAKIDDLEIPDIRLSSINGGSKNGLLVKPATGSIILVADLSCGNLRELCAVAYSEIESVRFHQGDTTITADDKKTEVVVGGSSAIVQDADIKLCKGDSSVVVESDDVTIKKGGNSVVVKSDVVEINGGNNGGLVKIEKLKNYITILETAIKTGISSVGENSTIGISGSAGATAFGNAIGQAQSHIKDMENPKVTH